MTRPWGKFLPEITVPAGGYDLGFTYSGAKVATIPAGTYDSILTLGAALATALESAASALAWTVAVSELGIVTIDADGAWTVNFGTTDDALETLLGFAGSETVDGSYTLTATSPHTHGWYPGSITYSRRSDRGVGISSGAMWIPQGGAAVRTWAGDGEQCTVCPPTLPVRRAIRFDIVDVSEAQDPVRGVMALAGAHLASRFRWYMDRSVGQVGALGDAGDPWTDTDDDCDYWIVDLADDPEVARVPQNPRKYSVELVLSGVAP
jgi:hypothetical protein